MCWRGVSKQKGMGMTKGLKGKLPGGGKGIGCRLQRREKGGEKEPSKILLCKERRKGKGRAWRGGNIEREGGKEKALNPNRRKS